MVRNEHTLKGSDGASKTLPVFMGPEDIRGIVCIQTPPGKKIEHMGVKIELLGIIGACDVWEGGMGAEDASCGASGALRSCLWSLLNVALARDTAAAAHILFFFSLPPHARMDAQS